MRPRVPIPASGVAPPWKNRPLLSESIDYAVSLTTGSAPHPHFYGQPLICHTLFFLAYYYYLPLTQHKLVRKSNHNIWLVT